MRPDPDGPPIDIQVRIFLIDVIDVNEVDESFEVDFSLTLSWREILKHRFGLLAVAIILLAISVTIDWFFHSDRPLRILLEDGAKLCGIFAWTAFHAAAAWKAITADEAFGE